MEGLCTTPMHATDVDDDDDFNYYPTVIVELADTSCLLLTDYIRCGDRFHT